MKQTKISWVDYTWNPWQGCNKISEGCSNCYMFRDKKRFGQDGSNIYKSSISVFNKPYSIKNPSSIFVCSWSDFFLPEAKEWRLDALKIIKSTSKHKYLILTKRPELIDSGIYLNTKNIFLGVSIENNKSLKRIDQLTPYTSYKNYFLSIEPLLEDINIESYLMKSFLNSSIFKPGWIIIGCESGPNKRETKIEWIESIVNICLFANIPVFVKQINLNGKVIEDINLFPKQIRYQQFPEFLK